MNTDLSSLTRVCDYYRRETWIKPIWPNQGSFQWFLRSHRGVLSQQGALVSLNRTRFIHSRNFPTVVAGLLGLKSEDGVADGK